MSTLTIILSIFSPIACVIISSFFLWKIKTSVAQLNHSHTEALAIFKALLDKDMKHLESYLNRQLRVFSTTFDKEYIAYQDVWNKLLSFQEKASLTFSIILLGSERLDEFKSEFDDFKKAHDELNEATLRNSPFVDKAISKAIYDFLNMREIIELRLSCGQPNPSSQGVNRESALEAATEISKELISSVQNIADLIRSRIISVAE
ncbi:MAG: hypothetical protein NTY51_12820 [Deltaproteobacteria bacterium]|nr:hypothetical protein [Deltaproteobacteria bacterium]